MAELWVGSRRVCRALKIARSARERMRGRLGTSDWSDCDGLLLPSCKMIHTFFMRYPIDVVFCDRQMKVVKTIKGLKPSRISGHLGAFSVVELPVGTIEKFEINVGNQIEVRDGEHKA